MKCRSGLVLALPLAVLSILLFSCEGDSGRELESQRPTEPFVASPQPVAEVDVKTLEIGASAPDFLLPAEDGKFYRLSDFDEAEVLVVIFTCNHCPTAQAYEDRMISIAEDYRGKGVAVIGISPNSPRGLLLEELGYSDLGDDYDEMKIRFRDKGYNFPYLYDGDTQSVSMQYGPVATPHSFVFDRDRKLRYTGRLDGSEKPGTADGEDLRNAIDAVLAGEPVSEPVTKTFGCSTKWGWKVAWKEQVNKEWAESPVELKEIDVAGLKELVANDSGKLRLINVWATWCGPCVIEYPELIKIHRMYKGRDFEFVSVSADSLDEKDRVLKFLKEKESAVQNYIFSEDDLYLLIEAIDPNWDGALPYTLLVEPDGKVAYAHPGAIDPLEVKRAIVDHPMIGRYY